MAYYPLFLDLGAADILVVGAGAVGQRKIASVLRASPRSLLVLDPAFTDESMMELRSLGPVTCEKRFFTEDDIRGRQLVFAATSDAGVNERIALLCRERNILCNSITTPAAGGCIVPAHFTEGDITVAFSTQGHSPALARRLRQDLEDWVGKRYIPLLTVMKRVRPLLLDLGMASEENSTVLRALINSSLARHLECGEYAEAAGILEHFLPAALHSRVGELLHGL